MAARFVWLSAHQVHAYREEWRAIDRRFPHFDAPPEGVGLAEHWETLALLRTAARQELRQATIDAASALADEGFDGKFPIAV